MGGGKFRLGCFRCNSGQCLESFRCFVMIALQGQELAQSVEGVWIVRICFQDLTVSIFGLRQLSILMKFLRLLACAGKRSPFQPITEIPARLRLHQEAMDGAFLGAE